SVAASSRNGTSTANASFEDSSSSAEPAAPPAMVSTVSRLKIARGNSAISRRNPSAADRYPGSAATVLVALADTTGTPTNTSAGQVMKVPPPATALITPPSTPATSSRRKSVTESSCRFAARATLAARDKGGKGRRPMVPGRRKPVVYGGQ